MKSMTAFIENIDANLGYGVRVKTLNGRYLDIKNLYLPTELQFLEKDLRNLVKSNFRRGTVDVSFFRSGSKEDVIFSGDNLKKFKKSYVQIQSFSKGVGVEPPRNLNQFIQLRSQLGLDKEKNSISSEQKTAMLRWFEQSLVKVQEERIREGKSLKKHLMSLIKGIQDHLRDLVKEKENLLKYKKDKLTKKLKSLKLDQGSLKDSGRYEQEVTILVEKSDITEEIIRLKEHLKHFKTLAQKKENVEGAKLYFYTQELLREVNTMGSKLQGSEFTLLVVNMKSLIEQIREQVQNVE